MRIFISGSISETELPSEVLSSIDDSVRRNYQIIVGDAGGVDKTVQKILSDKKYPNVMVYHIGEKPRNLMNKDWTNRKVPVEAENNVYNRNGRFTREAQMVKDKAMSQDADFGLVIWKDTSINRFGKKSVSKGSLNNIVRLLNHNKYVGLYYIPKPEKGIMKFRDLETFRVEVIDNLVDEATKKYFYNELLPRVYEENETYSVEKGESKPRYYQPSLFE